MIKRQYFMRGVIYDNVGITNKFETQFITVKSFYNKSFEVFTQFQEDLKKFAKVHDCENWQVKIFTRVK